jgi:hypothetical protein
VGGGTGTLFFTDRFRGRFGFGGSAVAAGCSSADDDGA